MFEKKLVDELVQINQYLEADNLPEILMKAVARIMDADRAIVILSDGTKLSDGRRDLAVQYSSHPLDQMTLSRSVIEDAMGSKTRTAMRNEAVNPTRSMGLHKIRSCMAATVYHGDAIIGALYCDIRKHKRDFNENDAKNLRAVADTVAPIILRIRSIEIDAPSKMSSSSHQPRSQDLVGVSASIRTLRDDISKTARLSQTVLITGPSGCGKEVVARLLHLRSRRKGKFVAMNCAESVESVLASELFGHEKGAFTDASVSRSGLILAADNGTLFLDEIGNASLDFQAKLLRVLETREVRPVGSDTPVAKVNVRFLFATNKNLDLMVAEKSFMHDLFYRINQIRLSVTALANRKEDIPVLAEFYAKPKAISVDAVKHLCDLEWPGNVRELMHLVELSRDLSGEEITLDDVLTAARYSSKLDKVQTAIYAIDSGEMSFYQLKSGLEEGKYSASDLERILQAIYTSTEGNWAEAGRKLGMRSKEDLKKFDNFIYNSKKRYNILSNS